MRKFLLSSLLIFAAFHFAFAQVVTLSTYPTTTIAANSNVNITPSGTPSNAPKMTAFTSTGFKGQLCVIPATGVVRITNAYPAGTYTITVRGFSGAVTATTSFLLQVNNPLCGTGLFNAGPNINVGTNLSAFAIGDFNQSGNQDIAATNASNVNNVSFALNTGTGGFSGASNIGVGANPKSIALCDFNGDGKIDFATGNSDNTVSIRLGFGAGGFNTAPDVAVGSGANSIAVGDFNKDGKADFATGNFSSNTVSIRLGNGAGGFTGTTDIPVGTNPTAIAIGDFNADGNPDFVTTNFLSYTASVRLGDGLGGFSGNTEVSVQTFPVSVEVADVNGDAKQDIIVANSGGGVSVHLGNGSGAFGTTTYVSVGSSPNAVTTGDFNGDGKTDIATANAGNGSPTISIRLGDGLGNFSGTTELPISANPGKLLTGDLNNDGRQDLIALHNNGNAISIRFGSDKEINVKGNNTNIADGDSTPSLTDHTDFGNVGSTLVRSFTIQNTGTANLTINNIIITGTDSALFTKGGIPLPIMIGAGRDTFFTVSFIPTSTGLKTATVKILSDDCDEAVYDFAIQGTGAAPALGTYPATTIATAGGNATVLPSAPPSAAASINAYTSAAFKGTFHVNPSTGAVKITNAHPAGTYTVTLKVQNGFSTAVTSFQLMVNNSSCGNVGNITAVPVAGNVYPIVVGDFNDDGKQDLAAAVSYSNGGPVSVRLGDGAGGFTGTTNVTVGNYPMGLVVNDFNGDGKQDFATANASGNSISVRMGNGLGGFTGTTTIITGTGPGALATGDFNGDSKPDLVAAHEGGNFVTVKLGDGTGNFTGNTQVAVANAPRDIILSDFNNDGNIDFATANSSSNSVSIRLGDGAGNFNGTLNVPVGNAPQSITTADLNKDGFTDFVTANTNANTISVCYGNGTGNFSAAVELSVGALAITVCIVDFNGDGNADIITTMQPNLLSIRYGDGAGGFTNNHQTNLVNYPLGIATGDFNGDGKTDIAFGRSSNGTPGISILLSSANEISITGNNTPIPDGSNSPNAATHTVFDNTSTISRTYTIQNTGLVNLNISSFKISGLDSGMFVPGGITLPASLPPNTSATFTISFIPTLSGLRTATINVINDDCDEAVYDFAVQGTATVPVLGNYPSTTITAAGSNTVITPSLAPANTTTISAFTTPDFKGILQVNPSTGIVSVTNAHPAGTYIITVKAMYSNAIATKTFTLQIGSPACSQGLFYNGTDVTAAITGTTAYSIISGDFNNDGKADFAVADYSNGKVGIRLGNGSGTFTAAPFVNVGTQPVFVSIADFNNDGNQDFASVNQAGNSVSIRLGNGTGNFTGTADITVGNSPRSMAVADFNGDGNPDFAVTNYNDNTVSVFLGNGSGGFSFSTNLTGLQGPKSMILIDFNSDGVRDLLVANYLSNTVSVFYGNGIGGFSSAANISIGNYPDALIAGDFNKDGKTDFGFYSSSNNTYAIALVNGSGGINGLSGFGTNTVTGAISGDFNNDRNPDIVIASIGSGSVAPFLGNGSGNFSSPNYFTLPASPTALTMADVDNNGIQDLLFAVNNNVVIRLGGANDIKLSSYTVPIPANDSTPDVADFTDFGNVDSSYSRTFTITNNSPFPLTVNSISLSGLHASSFSVQGNSFPATLPANTSTTFNLVFLPATTGLKSATVKVNSNNCQTPDYLFAIQGTGITYTSAITYPVTVLTPSGKALTVVPTLPPSGATPFTATASPGFKGVLQINPVSGAVTVINPYPAGVYTITVRAYTFQTSFSLLVTNPACSQGRFTGSLNEPVGTNPNAIAISDFNGDGKPDFVTANYSSNNVSVRLGNGSGSFSAALNNAVGTNPYAIVIADFNRDGKQDVAVTNTAANTISIRLGNGAGNFTTAANVATGNGPRGIVTADFNGDGKADIATANYNSASVSIRLGDGTGGFNLTGEIPVASFPNMLWVDDFNKDGNADFAVSNAGTSNIISIRLGNGTGGFISAPDLPVATATSAIAGGDINSDGNPDLLVAVNGGNAVSVFAGNGAGGFNLLANVAVGGSSNYISVADFNGDGKTDFAVANSNNTPLSVWLGNGSGSFLSSGQSIISLSGPAAIAVADFNGDGRHDLAIVNASNNTVSIRLGTDNEINIRGNNTDIAVGNSLPDTTHHTDFGTVSNGSTLIRTFSIQNTGADTLKISNIYINGTDSLLFSVGGITLPAIILPGVSATFNTSFNSTGNGFKTARVNIINNDCDESVYDFVVRGTAACSPSSASNVWLGTTPDWNLASNWSLNFVPSECTKVVVNSGVPFMPEVTSLTSACYSLTLNNGATVIVKSGGHLNITANNP